MDPTLTVIQQWVDAIDTLGTIGMFVVIGFVVYTRRVRLKAEVDEREAAWQKRLDEQTREAAERIAYIEARRAEERADKIAALNNLATLSDALDGVADLLQRVREEVLRGDQSRPR